MILRKSLRQSHLLSTSCSTVGIWIVPTQSLLLRLAPLLSRSLILRRRSPLALVLRSGRLVPYATISLLLSCLEHILQARTSPIRWNRWCCLLPREAGCASWPLVLLTLLPVVLHPVSLLFSSAASKRMRLQPRGLRPSCLPYVRWRVGGRGGAVRGY
jgi:hypothetical protein